MYDSVNNPTLECHQSNLVSVFWLLMSCGEWAVLIFQNTIIYGFCDRSVYFVSSIANVGSPFNKINLY